MKPPRPADSVCSAGLRAGTGYKNPPQHAENPFVVVENAGDRSGGACREGRITVGRTGGGEVGRRGPTPGRSWSRATRQQVIDTLLRDAMIEIRALAYTPDMASHPDGHLVEIGLIADVCHNLPGAAEPQPVGEYDALVWTWQTANQFQKSWLRSHLSRIPVDLSFLELAPKLPRPATAPDTRPHWRAWQWPRNPGAFVAADSATLSDLVRRARAAQEPDPRFGPVREAFIESMLRHLHPDGRHILR